MPRIAGYVRNHRKLARISAAGVTTAGAAAIALTGVAGTAHAAEPAKAPAKTVTAQATAHTAAKQVSDQAAAQKHAAGTSAHAGSGKDYPDNLDGWIRQSLDIMHKHNIPGSYDGIKRNIMRESSGNPNAVNNWDVNAQQGIPSKGLLQVIKPTFEQYHVKGTSHKLTDPVANITAACNYAADKYGSMDHVDSAY